VLKRSAGALYYRMWGPHGRDTVQERSDRVLELVRELFYEFVFCAISVDGE
jgi:hypothetical protein